MIKFAWQYRRELVPVWAVLATLIAGLLARYLLTGLGWIQVALLALLAVSPLFIRAFRLASKWRRRWNYLFPLLAIVWTVRAHQATAENQIPWLAISLFGGGLVVYGVNAFNLSLGEKVSMEGELRDWPERAKRINMPNLRWVKTKLVPGQGWTARLTWDPGHYQVDDVIRSVAKIEGARGLEAGSLRLMPHGRATNYVDAIYIEDDPNTSAIEWRGLSPEHVESYSVLDPVPVGERRDGTVKTVARYDKQGSRIILLGGSKGSGKSGVANNFIGEDACRNDVVDINIDLKGGVEFGPWKEVALATAKKMEQVAEIMVALKAAGEYRMDRMEAEGMRLWIPSPENPAVNVNIDEIRKLATSSGGSAKQQRALLDQLIDICTLYRATGIGLLMAGQHLTLEAVGSSQVRTQADIRIGMRCNDSSSATFIFPDDEVKLHKIPSSAPGTAFMKDGDEFDPIPWRGYLWTDELVKQVAELRRGGGAELDEGTAKAMCEASQWFAEIWAARQGRPSPSAGDSDGDTYDDVPWDVEEPEERVSLDKGIDGLPPAGTEDVSLSTIVRARRERGGTSNTVSMRSRPQPKLGEKEALAAMKALLRERGGHGATAKELYSAATRSSSWFHPIITRWIDDEGIVERTAHGTYAMVLARSSAYRA